MIAAEPWVLAQSSRVSRRLAAEARNLRNGKNLQSLKVVADGTRNMEYGGGPGKLKEGLIEESEGEHKVEPGVGNCSCSCLRLGPA